MEPILKPLITMGVMAVVFILISIPLVLKKVPPNPIYGFRTCKTFSSREIWYRANYVGGIGIIAASLVTLIAYFFLYAYRDCLSFEQMNLTALALSVGPLLLSVIISLMQIRKM